jgi:hypothetical protein
VNIGKGVVGQGGLIFGSLFAVESFTKVVNNLFVFRITSG